MSVDPPEAAHDLHLVGLAAMAVHDHPPGLHPIELITAARQGFTLEQGRAVLEDAGLMDALTRQWRSRPPNPAVLGLAQAGGERGQVHLRLLDRSGQLLELGRRSQYGLAASTSGRGPEVLVDMGTRDGTVVTRQVFHDAGLLDIRIESELDATGSFPVIALYSLTDGEPPAGQLLFLLTPASAGQELKSYAECRLRADATLSSDRLSLFPVPIPAHELAPELLGLVSHSVAVAKLPWKEAWRQAALAAPEGHPLRAAVTEGLSART